MSSLTIFLGASVVRRAFATLGARPPRMVFMIEIEPMRLLALAASLFWLALAGCPEAQSPDSQGQVQPTYPCQKDDDCMSPSCGPCSSGAKLLQSSPACAVNPCPNVAVVCSSQKVCVVK